MILNIAMSSKLSDQQRAIVNEALTRNMCIIACAGSGKTTTIIHRINYLLTIHHVPASDIILTTFTRNAADDMAKKIEALCGTAASGIVIGTLDSISQRVMRVIHDTRGVERKYDFTQYQRLFYEYLSTDEGQAYARMFGYFFFDEFQDANELQYQILCQFERAGVVVVVIGDDSQNIYSFRGSNIKYIIDFKKNFPSTAVHILSNNYRSTPQIIAVANESISNNRIQIQKKMIPNAPAVMQADGTPMLPHVIYHKNLDEECKFVCAMIHTKLRGLVVGHRLHEIAILSRNNMPLKMMETFLCKSGLNNMYVDIDDKTYIRNMARKNKIVLCTVHGAKGLEWDHVFIIGCSDKYFPMDKRANSVVEDRRLFYVAVTRAKKSLFIHYSGQERVITSKFLSDRISFRKSTDMKHHPSRYVQEIPRELFKFLACDPSSFVHNITSGVVVKTGLTDLIKALNEPHYNWLQDHFLTDFEEVELYPGRQHTYALRRACGEAHFGQFVENLIRRQFGNLRDHFAEGVLHYYPLEEHESVLRNEIIKVLGVPIDIMYYMTTRQVRAMMREKFSTEQIGMTLLLIEKVREHAYRYGLNPENIIIDDAAKVPMEMIEKLKTAYTIYQDATRDWSEILYEIFYVSLATSVVRGKRWGALYSKVTAENLAEYGDLYSNIYEHYITPREYDRASVYMKIEVPVTSEQAAVGVEYKYGSIISGEIDLIADWMLIDVKCYSNNALNLNNIAQVMCYYEMLWLSKEPAHQEIREKITHLEIFNALQGVLYRIPISRELMGDRAMEILKMMIIARDEQIDRYDVESDDPLLAEMKTLEVIDHSLE